MSQERDLISGGEVGQIERLIVNILPIAEAVASELVPRVGLRRAVTHRQHIGLVKSHHGIAEAKGGTTDSRHVERRRNQSGLIAFRGILESRHIRSGASHDRPGGCSSGFNRPALHGARFKILGVRLSVSDWNHTLGENTDGAKRQQYGA